MHSPRCAPYDWLTARILSRLILSASELVSICSFVLRFKKSQIEQLCQAQLDFARKTTGKKTTTSSNATVLSFHPQISLATHTRTQREREIRALSQWKWFTKANLNTDVSDRSTLDFLWDNLRICTSHLQTPQLDERPKIFALVTPQGVQHDVLNLLCDSLPLFSMHFMSSQLYYI